MAAQGLQSTRLIDNVASGNPRPQVEIPTHFLVARPIHLWVRWHGHATFLYFAIESKSTSPTLCKLVDAQDAHPYRERSA